MLRTRQTRREAAAWTVALTGIWSQLSTFVFSGRRAGGDLDGWQPASGGGLGAAAAGSVLIVLAVAVLAVAVLALALASRKQTLILGGAVRAAAAALLRLAHRPAPIWGRAGTLRLRPNTLRATRAHGVPLTLATLANQLTGFLILDLSLRALGITTAEISLAESSPTWSLARLVESLPLTPGGLGLVELGLTGTLLAFGGPHAPIAAAVLLYRGLSVVPTLLLGGLAGPTWKLRWSS